LYFTTVAKKLTLDEYKAQISHRTDLVCIADEYINSRTPIFHQCLKNSNHKWKARPDNVSPGGGCPHCFGSVKLTLDEYKAQISHRTDLICTATEYLGNNKSIQHQCLKCVNYKWTATPGSIKRGSGCPLCSRVKTTSSHTLTLDQYKNQIKDKNVICIADAYVNTHTPILHQCKKDSSHKWLARPHDVKQDTSCPHCAGNVKLTLDEYKAQISYRTDLMCIADEYVNDCTPILHQCLKNCGHKWLASPSNVKQHEGCPHCAGNVKLTLNKYKKQALAYGVECIADEYLGARTPIMHQCLKNCDHKWWSKPNNVKQDYGCPYCNSLKQEPRCRVWFETKFQRSFPKSYPKWLKNKGRMELDGYCEELNLAFEYNGVQHYKPHKNNFRGGESAFVKTINNDMLKAKLCAEYGVVLVVVPYWKKNIEAFLEEYFVSLYYVLSGLFCVRTKFLGLMS
jgi:hypothetical protein